MGRIFFFEWQVVLNWEDVVKVQKVMDRGIAIVVRAPKTTSYEFDKLQHRDRVWTWLVSLHNDSIIGSHPRGDRREMTAAAASSSSSTASSALHGGSRKISRRSLRRTNSDPFQLSQLAFDFDFDFTEPPLLGTDPSLLPLSQIGTKSTKKFPPPASTTLSSSSSPPKRILEHSESLPVVDTTLLSKDTPTGQTLEKKWSDVVEEMSSYSEVAIQVREDKQTHIATPRTWENKIFFFFCSMHG